MSRRILVRGLLAALSGAILQAFLVAQTCSRTFGPMGASFRPSQTVYYDQVWSVPASAPSGWTFAWSQGQDIYARRFDLNLNPLGNQFLVNPSYNLETQDEPAISYSKTTGNFLIAWSEHYGYDGSGMSIMGRTFNPWGNPLGGEFLINSITFASQWRPLLAPTPAGGWVAAWSGDNDGNAYIKILGSNGAWLSGDILVNTYTYDAQVDTCAAVNPSGTIFVAYVDFSGHAGGGAGLDIYGRTFGSAGNPLQPQEFLLTAFTSNGHQRDPRVAADGLGRFFVVWADQLGDGSGYGIFERVFDRNGVPLAPEFQVNTTTDGDQRRPCIVVDQLGRAVVTWEDYSLGAGNPQIRARRFNGQANPFGSDFVINDNPTLGAILPNPGMDSTGTDIVIGYQGPGAPGNGVDLYARKFKSTAGPQTYCVAKVSGLGCTPAIGYSGSPSATSGNPFLITASNVLSHKLALLFYGYDSAFTPYQGSVICVAPPLKYIATQDTGGTSSGTDCSGTASTDFNVRIRSGADPRLIPGSTISARWIYHDTQDPTGFGTGMTNALRFAICP